MQYRFLTFYALLNTVKTKIPFIKQWSSMLNALVDLHLDFQADDLCIVLSGDSIYILSLFHLQHLIGSFHFRWLFVAQQ